MQRRTWTIVYRLFSLTLVAAATVGLAGGRVVEAVFMLALAGLTEAIVRSWQRTGAAVHHTLVAVARVRRGTYDFDARTLDVEVRGVPVRVDVLEVSCDSCPVVTPALRARARRSGRDRCLVQVTADALSVAAVLRAIDVCAAMAAGTKAGPYRQIAATAPASR